MADLEGAYSAKKELNRWKPKLVSPVTSAWAFVAALMWLSVVLLVVLDMAQSNMGELLQRYMKPYLEWVSVFALPLAIACTVAAIASELVSQFRVPPPLFRVRDQLTRALGDLELLDLDHKDRWRGMYWVSPVAKWDRKTRAYSVLFDINTVKATPELFQQKLLEAIAGFRGVQDVTIEPWRTKRGYRRCFKLTLWYGTNPYEKTLDEMKPW